MIGSGWQIQSKSKCLSHTEDKTLIKQNILGGFSLVDHIVFSSVFSISILNTLIKPLIKTNQKRAKERSRDQRKFGNNKILGNISVKSIITITSLHIKITLIKNNNYDNNNKWLQKYNSCLVIIAVWYLFCISFTKGVQKAHTWYSNAGRQKDEYRASQKP